MPLSEFPLAPEDASGDDPPAIRVAPPGPMSRSASARLDAVECPSFGARRDRRAEASGVDHGPIVLSSGKGSNVYDVDGNRYLDLAAGFGALLLGHGANAVVRALEAQSDRLLLGLGDVYSADAKVGLLERVTALHSGEKPRAILTQSGSDAVTAAIKTAALATGRPGLLAFEGAYHGLGYAPLAACGLRESYRAPFAAQLNPEVVSVPYPRDAEGAAKSLELAEKALKQGKIGGVLVEPILGRGGCVVPPDGFLASLGEAAHRHGALLIADEIWTGLGRSGSTVRSKDAGANADILCFGKGLGGGLPIAACVAPDAIMQTWARPEEVVHTSTHAGSPLACAAALATLDTLRFRKLVARSAEVGARFLATLAAALDGRAVAVRGAGLMIGVELATPERALAASRALLARGYLVLTGGGRGETLTLTPPLTIGEERLGEFSSALAEVLA